MLLGAWGNKSGGGGGGGVIVSDSDGSRHLNPATPVLPPGSTSSEAFAAGGLQRNGTSRRSPQIRYLALIAAFAVYLILGASTFSSIEAPAIEAIANNVEQLRGKFLARHPNIKDSELEDFLEAVIVASQHGISALKNSSNELNWSFGQSLFFATTVVTTIGYGHVTPISNGGKIFCMVYSIIGIPLLLILLSASVERLMVPANWILGLLNRKLGHLYQQFNIRLLHLLILVLILGVTLLLIPSFVFAYTERNWGLLDAFYYCFISLTTIGLGDFIPGDDAQQKYREVYKIGTTIYLITGLIGMMLLLTVFYEIPQLNLGHWFRSDMMAGAYAEVDEEKTRLRPDSPQRSYSTQSGLDKLAGIFMGQAGGGGREAQRSVIVKVRPHQTQDDDDEYSPAEPLSRPVHVP